MPNKSEGEGNKLSLTVFLIKADYDEIDDFIDFDGGYKVIDVSINKDFTGQLIYQGGFKSVPSWVTLFEEVDGFDKRNLYNRSCKAVFVLKCQDRFFCFTFGHSRQLIDSLAYERNFGLKVALNSSDPKNIKSIDKTNVGHVALHSREQSTRNIEFGDFAFDSDVDILKSLTAKSVKENENDENQTISGRDSVAIYTRVKIDAFPEIAELLLTNYLSDKYKEIYPEIDFIQEERDKEVLEKLNQGLIKNILNKKFDLVWMAIPELLDWIDVDGFSYKKISRNDNPKKPGPVITDDLDINDWVSTCNINDKLTFGNLKTKKIYLYWKDGRAPTPYKVYRCLNAEVDIDNEKYILNDGAWYRIQASFVNDVNNFYKKIEDSPISLPSFGIMNEPEYLSHVCEGHNQYCLMDCKHIMIGGKGSRVEFCDIFSLEKDLIHVKRYGGPGLLSHLFQQALVSADCFLHEEDFRREVNDKLAEGFKLENVLLEPKAEDYPIHLAIMSKVPGPLELPFFGKVSVRHTVKRLRNMGFKVFKLKIDR